MNAQINTSGFIMKNVSVKEEYTTSKSVSDSTKKNAASFVIQAKKIARKMATNYNIKKKAFEAASTSFHQNGNLDISRIHSYKTSDDIFKRKVMLKEGQSHGLVCTLDFSSSMKSLIPAVAKQFLITSLFCKYINIEFRFFTFTSDYANRGNGDAYMAKNAFKLVGGEEYARFVDIGNQTMSEKQLIESFYHILSFVKVSYSSSTVFSLKYDAYLKRTFKDMSCTPLLAAAYQTFLVAKDMQSRGIQNVNILTINDGDNNCYFLNDTNLQQLSVEDPFTRRIYDVNPKNVGKNGILSAINKMVRDNGIKTYNMFLDKDMSTDDIISTTNTYLYSTDIPTRRLPVDVISKLYKDVMAKGMAEIKNLAFYDSVILVDTVIFPTLENEKIISATDPLYLEKRAAGIKKLAALGTFLSDIMVEDFKLSNLPK